MAAYCTATEARKLAEIITTGIVDDTDLGVFIENADSEVDALLAGAGYTAPITGTVPNVIRKLSMYLAITDAAIAAFGNDNVRGVLPAGLAAKAEAIKQAIIDGDLQIPRPDISPEVGADTRRDATHSEFSLDGNVPLDQED